VWNADFEMRNGELPEVQMPDVRAQGQKQTYNRKDAKHAKKIVFEINSLRTWRDRSGRLGGRRAEDQEPEVICRRTKAKTRCVTSIKN
jgi:hypothetical protein